MWLLFVGKQLVWQVLVRNHVSILSCCSAVLCQALQQYTGCIFNWILHVLTTVLCYHMGTKFHRVNFAFFLKHLYYKIFKGFNFRGFIMGVITTPFSGLVVRWYSWISEQVVAKENITRSFFPVVSGWMKVTKERHSRACLAQRRCVFFCGRSLTKNFAGIIFHGLAGSL